MRLFEIAGNRFEDDLANILRVMQGRANNPGSGQRPTTSKVLWSDINNRLQGYGAIDSDMMNRIKDKIDPNGQLIADVLPDGILLKTSIESPEKSQPIDIPRAKTVDQMAHRVVSKEF